MALLPDDLPRILLEDDPLFGPLIACFACKVPFDHAEHMPRMLKQCGHTVCHQCLLKSFTGAGSSSSSSSSSSTTGGCPICQAQVAVNDTSTADLPANEMLLKFLHSLSQQPQQQQSERPNDGHQCQYCEEKPSDFGCVECAIQYCEACWKSVHRGGLAGHQQMSSADVHRTRCPIHAGKTTDFVCLDPKCGDALVCYLCKESGVHEGHSVKLIDVVAAGKRHEMQAAIAKLQASVAFGVRTFVDAHASVQLLRPHDQREPEGAEQAARMAAPSNLMRAVDDIRERFGQLRQLLDQRESTLIKQVEDIASKKTELLEEQKTELSAFLLDAYASLHQAITGIATTNNREFLSFLDRMDRLEELSATKLYPLPVVTADVGIKFGDGLVVGIGAYGSPTGDDGLVPQSREPSFESDEARRRRKEDEEVERLRQLIQQSKSSSSSSDRPDTFNPAVFNAAGKGDIVQLKAVLAASGWLLDTPNKDGDTPLHNAASKGHVNVIEALFLLGSTAIDASNKEGRTPLFSAARNGHPNAIEALVRLGSKAIDTPDKRSWTPLYVAAANGRPSAIEALVRLGSTSVDIADKNDGWTPMHHAAQNGFPDVIEALVRVGTRVVDTPDNDGRTPLYIAASSGHHAAIDTLIRLESKAIDTPNKNGWTPLYSAASRGHVNAIKALVRLGSKAIDTCENDGWAPIHHAAQNGHANVIEALVQLGCKTIDTPNKIGRTPLYIAASNGHVMAIETLVRLGSKAIDTPNNEGRTPLYAAARNGDVSVIWKLIRLGSKAVNTQNKNGRTPLQAAKDLQDEGKRQQTIDVLRRHGAK